MNHATAKPFPADGSPLVCDAGHYRITLVRTIEGGATFYVHAGTHELYSEGFTDVSEAREVAHRWTLSLRRKARGESGTSVEQLIQDRHNQRNLAADVERFLKVQAEARQAEARQAAWDAIDVEQVAKDLNADLDARDAGYRQEIDQLVADSRAIVGDARGWYNARQEARRQADIVWESARGDYRPVRNTRTQVYRKPLTDAQKRIAHQHRDGVVYCGRGTGVSPASLRSMRDRVGGDFLMHDTVKHRIVGLRLPAGVTAELGQVAA